MREAKALVPSAWHWASGTAEPIRFLDLARGIHRSPDPWLRLVTATCCAASRFKGRGGRTLSEEWKDGPQSYLGLSIAGTRICS